MSDFVTLTCPNCGAKLEITSDVDRFACAHCGTEHLVKRAGGIVSLAPVVREIQQVRRGVDRTASELAIRRLREEIPALEARKKAIMETAPKKGPLPVLLPSLLIGALAWLFVALVLQDPAIATVCGVVVFFVAGPLLESRRNRRLEAQYAPLEREIASKKEELRRHERVVSD